MNKFNPQHGAEQYHEIRTRFLESNEGHLVNILDLVEKSIFDPNASADHIWSRIWDKPLYANTKVAQGGKNVEILDGTPLASNFRLIASDVWKIDWNRNSTFKWNQNGSYEALGSEIQSFFEKRHSEFPKFNSTKRKIARWRIYRIINAACGLLRLSNESNTPMKRLIDLAGGKDWTNEKLHHVFMDYFSLGAITTDHALTDLGLAIKPDIWLTRAAVDWGWFEPEMPKESPNSQIMNYFNKRKNTYDLLDKVKSIIPYVNPLDGCENNPLREIDYILMHSQKMGIKWNK